MYLNYIRVTERKPLWMKIRINDISTKNIIRYFKKIYSPTFKNSLVK